MARNRNQQKIQQRRTSKARSDDEMQGQRFTREKGGRRTHNSFLREIQDFFQTFQISPVQTIGGAIGGVIGVAGGIASVAQLWYMSSEPQHIGSVQNDLGIWDEFSARIFAFLFACLSISLGMSALNLLLTRSKQDVLNIIARIISIGCGLLISFSSGWIFRDDIASAGGVSFLLLVLGIGSAVFISKTYFRYSHELDQNINAERALHVMILSSVASSVVLFQTLLLPFLRGIL